MARGILCDINWDNGFAIPVANTENKDLEANVQKMEKEKIHLHNKLAEFKDRIHALTQHLKNVKQELNYTQSLQQAREKEIESETHFKILAEREIERLNQEMLRLENELVGLKERKNIMENNIFRSTQRIEGLKCQLNWDKQALEAWLEESARTDEDAITIEKYSQRDEGKIRDLMIRMERMTDDANKKRKQLDNEMTETIAAQMELDKTAQDFRRAQRERQDLIKQWQNTIEQMQKRDQDMDQCALQMAELKQQIREREAVIKEKAQFLKNEADNNNEFEKKISSSERQAAKLRSEYQTYETNRIQLENEFENLKKRVNRTAFALESLRTELKNIKKEIQLKNQGLTHSKNIHDSLTQKLKDMTENLLSSEEQATRMEKMLKDEEKNMKEIEAQMKYLGDLKFRKTEELTILENTEKTVLGQLSGNRATLRNLNSQITKLDHEALKQQEVIYNQDFQIMRLERKLAKLEGDLNSNEKDVLELRVAELTKNLEEKKMTKNLLEGQLKKLQNDLRHLVKHLDKGNEEKADLNHKIEDIHHYLDSSEKELKRKRFEKQELMIEDNLLKLSVKRLRDMLHHKADNVLSLEKRKLQLQTAMKERTEEIKLHMDMLHIQLKQTEQERQAISAELHERLSKIDKLKKRYELLMVSMAPPEGQEDRSQAYYVIKAAQEKEELQNDGDELDAKICKAEKELRALENTLHLLKTQNDTYHKSFSRITETSQEYEDKQKVEEQKRSIDEKYRYKRRQIRELQEDIESMNVRVKTLNKEDYDFNMMVHGKEKQIMKLNQDLDDQKLKLNRAVKQCSKLVKEIRFAKRLDVESHEEQDINIHELREFNKSLNKMLREAMDDCESLTEDVEHFFQQASLPLPSVSLLPGSQRSSRTSLRGAAPSGSPICSLSSSMSLSGDIPKVIDLGLGLTVTSPTLGMSSGGPSCRTSAPSSARSQPK
eukprot:gi/632978509/ref/XP_007905952.1/ PREDICTED: coiled-coil domain-containing protein 39 [Callorhinchus milii]